jgi:hypothetical protein
MRKKLLLIAAAAALALGQPTPVLARDCEDICADKAAANCENIDTFKCSAYIAGCLSGCSVGKIIHWFLAEE